MKRVTQGDLRACRVLCHRLSGRVQHLIRRLIGDSDASDAIVIDALLEIVRAASIYRNGAGLEAWADGIAVRVALERVPRRSRRRSASMRDLVSTPASPFSSAASAHRVSEFLATLCDPERHALVLRVLARLELKAIANLMRTPESSVREHLLSARAALRALVAMPASDTEQALCRERWAECSDRRALGVTLGAEDAEFCERFGSTDPAAASERALLEELGRHEPEPNANSRALVDAALGRVAARAERSERDDSAPAKAANGESRLGWLCLAGVTATLAVGLLLLPAPPVMPAVVSSGAHAPVAQPRIRLVYASGEVRVGGELATPESMSLADGETLSVAAGMACVSMDPGITFCASSGTLVRMGLSRGNARRLELETGQLALQLPPQASGAELTVVAGAVRTSAGSGRFTLEADQLQGVRANVLEGSLSLGVDGGDSTSVAAGQSAIVQNGQLELLPLPDDDAAAARELLQPTVALRRAAAAMLDLRRLPEEAEVLLDGRVFGATPLLAYIPSGVHTLVVRRGEHVLASLDFTAEPGKATALSLDGAPAIAEEPE